MTFCAQIQLRVYNIYSTIIQDSQRISVLQSILSLVRNLPIIILYIRRWFSFCDVLRAHSTPHIVGLSKSLHSFWQWFFDFQRINVCRSTLSSVRYQALIVMNGFSFCNNKNIKFLCLILVRSASWLVNTGMLLTRTLHVIKEGRALWLRNHEQYKIKYYCKWTRTKDYFAWNHRSKNLLWNHFKIFDLVRVLERHFSPACSDICKLIWFASARLPPAFWRSRFKVHGKDGSRFLEKSTNLTKTGIISWPHQWSFAIELELTDKNIP